MHRILVAGDFSGRSWRPDRQPLGPPLLVDRDDLQRLPERLDVLVDGENVKMAIGDLEDFHPDRLLAAIPASPPPPVERSVAPPTGTSSGLLDAILARDDPAPVQTPVRDAEDLSLFIRRVTAGQTVDPNDQVDRAPASTWLRAVLHDPKFQHLEAAWLGLKLLIEGIDESEAQIYLLDISLPELVAGHQQARDWLRLKGDWSLVVANYYFGQSDRDAAVVERLADIAGSVGATLLTGAEPPGEHLGERWNQLRRSQNASHVGLTLPRVLLRLPYGHGGLSIDSFAFEELQPVIQHSDYLWGNAAFVAARLIAAGLESGQVARRLDGLPFHVYQQNGESLAKPCAEVLMTEREAEVLLEMGLMPVASLKDQDGVLVVRYQSLAHPPASLAVLH